MKLKKNAPELSCVIISWNEENYLPRLLNSLKKQTYQNFELILADFNSTDRTREIAKNYGCKIVLGGKHSVARNNGAKSAQGKYLVFLDADGELKEENFIEKNLEKFKKSGKGVASTYMKTIEGKLLDKVIFGAYNLWMFLVKNFSPHGTGACIFVKNEVFKKINGFDEKVIFAEDMDFLKRASIHGYTILPIAINTSNRRLEYEGRLKIVAKLVYSGVYRLFYKEIDKSLFKYDKVN